MKARVHSARVPGVSEAEANVSYLRRQLLLYDALVDPAIASELLRRFYAAYEDLAFARQREREYLAGQRDILDWLAHNKPDDITWKIGVCLKNYPSDLGIQPYYDAMLDALRQRLGEVGGAYEVNL